MSTKTTFKRLALVTVGALGLGALSVAPSYAGQSYQEAGFRTGTFVSAPATATVGTEVSANFKVTGSCINAFANGTDTVTVTSTFTTQIDVAPVGANLVANSVDVSATVPTGLTNTNATTVRWASEANNGYRNSLQGKCTDNSSALTAYGSVKFTPDVPGTYVIVALPKDSTTGAATWTVVASAKTLGWNTAFINTTAGSQSVADATVSVSAAASTTMKARIDVAQGYGTTAGTDTATAAATKEVVVATTKGLVSKTNDYTAGAKSVTTAAGTEAVGDYYVFSNGDVGAASVTVTVGGVLVSTKTVTFIGAATKLVATKRTGQNTWIAPGATTIYDMTATDSAGSAVSRPAGLTVSSSDTAVATVAVSGNDTITVTGVAAGTATITVTDPATSAAATAATFSVTVAPAKSAAAPVISFDKSAYGVGELVTMTISSTMADSATASLFTTALVYSAGNIVWTAGSAPGATHAMVAGKVAYTFYAPAVSGTFTVTGTTGADVALTTAAVVTKTVDIVNPGADAAVDAANEAAQAASDATDAALAAADAADAATAAAQDAVDAVAALSAEVNTLIKALKAQITTLTNLVIKIQKKVKA